MTVDENETVMCLDGPVYDREAKSGSTHFRRDERLEQSLVDRVGYSRPLIGYLKHHRPARKALGLRRKLVVRELRCFEPDFAARWRGLNRVEKEIEDRAMEQIIIANDDQRC